MGDERTPTGRDTGGCEADPAASPEAAFDVAPELFGADAGESRRRLDDTAL